MLSLETALLFFSASCTLALVPGPDSLFVLTQSALHGRRAGLMVTTGLCTGLLGHTSAVTLGVAAIFQTSVLAFTGLKVLGAVYLLFLAWQAFRTGDTDVEATGDVSLSSGRLYVRGVIMNITNPKVAIFFLAFLPQFTDPDGGSVTLQILQLGLLFIAATLLIFGAIAWSSGFLADWLKRSPASQRVMNRIAGTVFIALAVRLLITEQ
ncbi:MAG: LysE family translocator [Gammaproteobacteria bacterium]|nr:LysE family translocator [Pseudomonadales bacterium]MCP5347725.1 LysE family translocator [Pseudomonadales bacterium]